MRRMAGWVAVLLCFGLVSALPHQMQHTDLPKLQNLASVSSVVQSCFEEIKFSQSERHDLANAISSVLHDLNVPTSAAAIAESKLHLQTDPLLATLTAHFKLRLDAALWFATAIATLPQLARKHKISDAQLETQVLSQIDFPPGKEMIGTAVTTVLTNLPDSEPLWTGEWVQPVSAAIAPMTSGSSGPGLGGAAAAADKGTEAADGAPNSAIDKALSALDKVADSYDSTQLSSGFGLYFSSKGPDESGTLSTIGLNQVFPSSLLELSETTLKFWPTQCEVATTVTAATGFKAGVAAASRGRSSEPEKLSTSAIFQQLYETAFQTAYQTSKNSSAAKTTTQRLITTILLACTLAVEGHTTA